MTPTAHHYARLHRDARRRALLRGIRDNGIAALIAGAVFAAREVAAAGVSMGALRGGIRSLERERLTRQRAAGGMLKRVKPCRWQNLASPSLSHRVSAYPDRLSNCSIAAQEFYDFECCFHAHNIAGFIFRWQAIFVLRLEKTSGNVYPYQGRHR